MTSRSLMRLLCAAAVMAAGARSAGAQASLAANADAATPARWSKHPTGKFRLEVPFPDGTRQADLTLTDSASTSVAMFWLVGDNVPLPMSVTVQGTDMILEAATQRGRFQVVLQRADDRVTGRWSLGSASGELHGRVAGNSTTP